MSDDPGERPGGWSAYWNLPGHDRRLLLLAVGLIPAVSFSLRIFGFKRTYTRLRIWGDKSPHSAGSRGSIQEARQIADLVGKAAWKSFYPATCLPRSLTLWAILRRYGHPADLKLGVRKRAGGIQAHAWVEVAGVEFYQPAESGEAYTPLDFPEHIA